MQAKRCPLVRGNHPVVCPTLNMLSGTHTSTFIR
jgi:hypothetical protein